LDAVKKEHEPRERLTDLVAATLADLARLSGAEERYQAATRLVEQLADAITLTGKVRAQAVVELRDERHRSQALLGERLGLSKARALDIVRATPTRAE
jgi:hypothetical protein